MAGYVTLPQETYDEAYRDFSWDSVPDHYNIARDHLRKHDDTRARVALFQAYPDGSRETYTFHQLDRISNQVANGLASLGVGAGDRVGIVVSQRPEFLFTSYACWKLGAVTVPTSILTGTEDLAYRFRTADVATAVVSEAATADFPSVREDCPDLEHVVRVGEDGPDDARPFASIREGFARSFDVASTDHSTPAMIIYTSGTTSKPKGVLHTHGKGVNPCPAAYMEHNRDILGKSIFWSPSDWVWIAGFANAIVPAFHYGRPLVGHPKEKFDPEHAFAIMAEFDVTDTLITATALQKMRSIDRPAARYDLSLDVIHSGGEPVPVELYEWVDETFDDVELVQGYGLTEAQPIVANCPDWFEPKPGTIGKPVPGYDVAIVDDETGERLPPGEEGMIAVKDDGAPGIFTQYIDEPEQTADAFLGDWLLSGDLATQDEEGYFWFETRDDDVIITSGYRVAPAEIEDAVAEHDAVSMVGVVGKSDETRNEIIKAFVELQPDVDPTESTRESIQSHVREHLAAYEYPREIEFTTLPLSESNKVDYGELRDRVADDVA